MIKKRLSTNTGQHTLFKPAAIVLLFSVFIFIPLLALDPELAVTQYVIDTWTITDGLPQNTVSHILQTQDGYLWIGTGNGLARFDGAGFTVFNRNNTPVFIGHDVLQLVEDRDKNLWINTGQGINLYKNGHFKNFAWQEELNCMNKLFPDDRGTLCAVNEKGVFRFNNGQFRYISNSSALSGMDYVFIDKDGNSFFCTPRGVFQFRNNRFEVVKGTEGLNITYIYKDRQGNLGPVNDNLVKKLKRGGTELFNLRHIPGNLPKNNIFEDQNGILWLGSEKGLWRICRGDIKIMTKEHGLAEGPVRKIYEDREGNLWVGSRLGLSRVKNPRLVTYSSEEGLGSDFPRSIYQDSRGSIWIGCDYANITRIMPGGQRKVYSTQTGLPENVGGSFHEDRQGLLLGGIGLFKFQNGKFVPFKTGKGVDIMPTRVILGDKTGRLWLGTYKGLVLLEDGEATTYTRENGLSGNMIYELMQAGDGTLWIGTARGLTIYKDGIFNAVKNGTGISQKPVQEIYLDQEGTVWLGTYGGLYRYRGCPEFSAFFHKTAEFPNTAYVIPWYW